jgi:hypothetical protein
MRYRLGVALFGLYAISSYKLTIILRTVYSVQLSSDRKEVEYLVQ